MRKIITLDALLKTSQILKKRGTSVLVGGCFDILHIGHIKFLQQAKLQADILIVLLENDMKVKHLKGNNRPIHTQQERAQILSAIEYVDIVVLLPHLTDDNQYSKIVNALHPDIIAVTQQDPFLEKKKNQAEQVGGKVYVVPKVDTFSSSRLAQQLGLE